VPGGGLGRLTERSIAKFIEALTHSIIQSGRALTSGQGSLQVEKPDNFISLAVDTI
jgi:hypothetical protein